MENIRKSPLLSLQFVMSPDVLPPAPHWGLKVEKVFSFSAGSANICLSISLRHAVSITSGFRFIIFVSFVGFCLFSLANIFNEMPRMKFQPLFNSF